MNGSHLILCFFRCETVKLPVPVFHDIYPSFSSLMDEIEVTYFHFLRRALRISHISASMLTLSLLGFEKIVVSNKYTYFSPCPFLYLNHILLLVNLDLHIIMSTIFSVESNDHAKGL